MQQSERVIIFDTTLRDGQQGAGTKVDAAGKIKIATQLDRIGVDIIEAGFPIASQGEHNTVLTIARMVKNAKVCALARSNQADIDAAVSALASLPEKRKRVHVFIATDAAHMSCKLQLTPSEVLARVSQYVAYAKQFVADIQFSPEVAVTTDMDFLFAVIDAAIEAGATTINIPDTKGYAMTDEYQDLIAAVVAHVGTRYQDVVVSVHCHDDHGLATANSLCGVRAGARQVQCTINGVGERAGNTSLEEVVMALTVRSDRFGLVHGVDTTKLVELSRLVEYEYGIVVPPNKAFVGNNAFAHESGIHQAGVLKGANLYEICAPELVGATRRLPIGKLSGKAGLQAALVALGYDSVSSIDIRKIYEQVMRIADSNRIGSFSEDELRTAVQTVIGTVSSNVAM